ncbi:MAG: calcium-binding protein [Gemmataceae bacterium]
MKSLLTTLTKLFSGRQTTTNKRNCRLQLEGLEERALMAGDVGAYLSGTTLYVNGDTAENNIEIYQLKDDSVRVEATDSTTRINGRTASTFTGSISNIIVNMSSGHDSVDIYDLDLSWDLTVDLGQGGDKLTIKDVTTGDDIRIETGGGGTTSKRDEIDIRSTQVGNNTNNDLEIHGTSGVEKLILDDVTVNDDFRAFLTKSGEYDQTFIYPTTKVLGKSSGGVAYVESDYLYVNGLEVESDADFRQADRLYMYNSHIGDDLLIDGTNEDNYVYVSSSNDITDVFDIDVFAGNDSVYIYTSDAVHIDGGTGNDYLRAGSGHDTVIGGDGNDTLRGEGGSDDLLGGNGNDSIEGGTGNDDLWGYNGNDTLKGDAGDDELHGEMGDDLFYGGNGADTLRGGGDDDTLYGEAGDDVVFGWYGNDSLFGGDGDDFLAGGYGKDTLNAGNGDDGLYGGRDTDSFNDGGGYDRIYKNDGDNNDLGNSVSNGFDVKITIDDNKEKGGFAAATWGQDDVYLVDKAFLMLVKRTGNVRLLEDMPTLWRGGNFTGNVGGVTNAIAVNGGSYIVYGNGTFSTETQALKTVIHETAHNFDSANEIKSAGESEALWDDFYDISWRENKPSWGSWEQARDTRKGGVYDDWFNTNTGFARGYGKHNPKEDWATSWEYYFFNTDSNGNPNNPDMQDKMDALDAFFSAFSS